MQKPTLYTAAEHRPGNWRARLTAGKLPGAGPVRLCVEPIVALVFGRHRDGVLSERVRRLIEQQQAASEIIVSWIQASAVAFFAVVYAISPKAFPPDVAFRPVPWALGFYAAFTALRIVLAHRRRIGDRLVAASAVIDIAVLMITIWSFHLQYQSPPALYLKAPTLMYVFILIALRAFRLEPRVVVLAGACAAAGWLALLLFAIAGAGTSAITRNYVEYMTSFKILIGAEIDKIVSILLVTMVLSLALVRARKLLVNSVAEEIAANDLSRFFPPEIAAQIRRSKDDPKSGRGERRDSAVLAIDLRGFTGLSRTQSAEDLIVLLGEYQTRLVPVIRANCGIVDKYLGDGILVSFGAVAPNSTYAADLCRAIEDILQTARSWRAEREARGLYAPPVGLAGAVGPAVFGTVGHENRLEYTIIGEVVNLAAKLEKHTKVEAVEALVTRQTFELAVQQGYQPRAVIEARPARVVAGTSDPIDLVVIG